MMKSPADGERGVRSVVLRVVSLARRLLWISIGALAPRPVPSRVKLLPRPTMKNPK
jgi:hypothetical protein